MTFAESPPHLPTRIPIHLLSLLIIFLDSVGPFQLLTLDDPNNGPTEDRVPDPPTDVRAEQLTPSSVTIRWEPPRTVDRILVRGYTLSYGTETAGAKRVVLEGADTLEYALHGLRPNTSYAFSLTAYNEADGEDSARVILLVRTPPMPARDAPEMDGMDALRPRGLRTERTGQRDEVWVHWEEPVTEEGRRPAYYVIQCSSNSQQRGDVQRLSVERSPALLNHLRDDEKYTVKVRAIFADGTQSGWSEKVTLNGQEQPRNKWSPRDTDQEEDFCGFELPSICDYIREGPWRWQRRNSTKDGFNMILQQSLNKETILPPSSSVAYSSAFGRLLSPVYGLRASDTFCLSSLMKVSKGAFGALFRLGVHFENEQRPIWLFRKSLQRIWPQGEWIRLSFQIRRRPIDRGFQIIFDVSKTTDSEQADFSISLDNIFLRAADCPSELEPYFGTAPGYFPLPQSLCVKPFPIRQSPRWSKKIECFVSLEWGGGIQFYIVELL